MLLTEILMPRGGGGHLFGVVSADGGDSDVEWVSTSNAAVREIGRDNNHPDFLPPGISSICCHGTANDRK